MVYQSLRLATAGLLMAVSACSAPPAPEPASVRPPSTMTSTSAPGPEKPGPERTAVVEPSRTKTSLARLNDRLIKAAWANDVPRARRLIGAGAQVNHQDRTEQSAFLIAASEGFPGLLDLVLRHGADVRSLDSYRGTALIRAAERGHADVVGRLLRTSIDPDHVNNLGWTALHEAIILGDGTQRYGDTVRLLVAGGADLRLPPRRDGIAPRQHARSRGQVAIAATLSRALAGASGSAPHQALLAAATTGDADGAALAVRAGADVEVTDDRGRTPLLLAATHDRRAVARLLVALGADPDRLDDRHDTPWLVTGVTGSVGMLEILLPAHPDLTIRNRFGGVSLIPASERGHVDYVRRVVRTGIAVNHVNDLGWTALLEAVILGDGSARYQQIVRILLAAGADPAIGDRDGVAAAEHARARGQVAVARILAPR